MASPYSDPAAMMDFFRQTGLPMPSSMPSAQEVRKQARSLSSDIFALWNTLNTIILRREETIRKRWMKKNKNARANILLRAWPDMPSRHRPDFWALAHTSSQLHRERFTNSFRYPYINLEDLTMARPLLLLLNSRARNPPSTFAHADVHACHVGRIRGIICPLFLNEHTMYLAGQDTKTTYGKLVSWDDDDNAFDLMHRGLQFHPGEGILALEAEKTILDFLVKCCQGIFQDIPPGDLSSQDLPVQPEPPALISQETSYAQLWIIAQEAPYRAPAKMDLQALKTLIAGRRAAAEDHIWDLREDPAYFVSTVVQFGDHSLERIIDSRGKRHPNDDDDMFWQRKLEVLVINAYATFLVWDQLHHRIVAVERAMPVELDAQAPLLAELLSAFLDLRLALDKCVKGVIHDLQNYVPSSPPIRPLFVREPNEYGTTKIKAQTKSNPSPGSLVHLMDRLWHEDQRFLYRLPNLVDEIQRLIESGKEARDLLSPLVAATFSNLALMAQVSHQVETFFPWSAGFENEEVGFESIQHMQELHDFQFLLKLQDKTPSLVPLAMPFQQKLHYPADKAPNETNINAMREAEANLDRFWKVIDDHFNKHGRGLSDILAKHGAATTREVKRTATYTQPPEGIQGGDERALAQFEQSMSAMHVGEVAHTERPRRFLAELPKEKIKTRSYASPKTSQRTPDNSTEHNEPETSFAVSKRALKVFQTVFHTPGQQRQHGEVAWSDFLHAMASAGCSIEKLHGSVWQFIPKQKDAVSWHGIHFHEPHPTGKISFTNARRIGRRLNRNYGWSVKTFTERVSSTRDDEDE